MSTTRLTLLGSTCLAGLLFGSAVQAAEPCRVQSQGSVDNMDNIQLGGGWNTNLICGNMSLTNTLQNQLNGATQGFQTIMSSVLQNATCAVASLPGLILQRANLGLYNLITNGIGQARLDFDRSKGTCRAIADKMLDVAGGQVGWNKLAEEKQ